KTYYMPSNAILVAVGDFKAPEVLAKIRAKFGKIPRGATPPPVLAVEPPQNGERRVVVAKQAQLPIVYVGYHVPNQTSADAFPLEMLSTILSEGRASRLYKRLVYERQLALEAGGDYNYFSQDPNLFWFWATPMPGQTAEAMEKALLAEMETLKKEPVTDEELQRAKNQVEATFVFQEDSVHRCAALLARFQVLPNGIVLRVAERPAVPIVVVSTFAHAGAVLDPPDRAGLANLTGALMTRGTAKHTGPQLDSAIEFVGGSLSAGAGRDGLGASLAVLKKDLGLGLDLLAEVLLTPTFPPDELKRKVAQIQAAIKRSEEDPGTVAGRALARLVFPRHPYGVPVEGTIESVGKLTRD